MSTFRSIFALLVVFAGTHSSSGEQTVVTNRLYHLRIDDRMEWSDFPKVPYAASLELTFNAKRIGRSATLQMRQQDVKQRWQVQLNGADLGSLPVDENDMVVYFDIPENLLLEVENKLVIQQQGTQVDDIRVGEVSIDDRPVDEVLGEANVELVVVDIESQQPIPCRITILDAAGSLQTLGCTSNDHLAVRPGIVFTATGQVTFGLPAGTYKAVAGRGFEYSIDEVAFTVNAGETLRRQLSIRREVPTDGYVACDTHIHTRTHSGHGDSTVQERMITIASEGIELPIATDHNAHIDHRPQAQEMNVLQFFTPVIGNEVTTRTGHFNIFPVALGARTPDHRSSEWKTTLDGIFATPDVRVAILNHARDVHSGTTPFGPKWFNDAAGENVAGWKMGFNAMEVVNSGATQSNVMQLFHDWMALLNRGYSITPVGSSDSHDVGRHFVGQGRTYIRCGDCDPGNIDVEQAVTSFRDGNVMVSYGLLVEMTVNGRFESGQLAEIRGSEVAIDLRVLGPSWVNADKIMLFLNGQLVREHKIDQGKARPERGVIWSDTWLLPTPSHDTHVIAIAIGPGITSPHWRTAKPYQPKSLDPTTHVIGCSGAIWLDADEDGQRQSARDYAMKLFSESNGDLKQLFKELSNYDEAVAVQAASLLETLGRPVVGDTVQRLLADSPARTKQGFLRYRKAWRACQMAAAGP